MNDKKHGLRWLRWPWSLLVCLLLLLLLRLWAVPVILLLAAWQKKHQPDGPAEGYCLQRTRRRLARLVWAALFLLIGLAAGVFFFDRLQSGRSRWGAEDYFTLAAAGCLAAGALAAGLYEGYTDLRDALVPEQSRLARSIRSQLPHPDEAPGVRELFALVDEDIRQNGQWFDRVAVGAEWVLGDEASFIPRIRAVFGRDEIRRRSSGKRTTTTRIVEIYLLDDRRQVQTTALRNPNELPALMDCLKLRAPDALFLPYAEYLDFCGKSEEEWNRLLLDYRRRKGEREAQAARAPQEPSTELPPAGSIPPPPLVQAAARPSPQREPPQPYLTLVSDQGVRQNHHAFTWEDVQLAAEGVTDGSYQTVSLLLPGGFQWMHIQAGDAADGRYTVCVSRPDPDKLRFFTTRCSHRQAAAWLLEFAQGQFRPEGRDWKDYTRQVEKAKK